MDIKDLKNKDKYFYTSEDSLKVKLSKKAKKTKLSGFAKVLDMVGVSVEDFYKAKSLLIYDEIKILRVIHLKSDYSYMLYLVEMCKMLEERGVIPGSMRHIVTLNPEIFKEE